MKRILIKGNEAIGEAAIQAESEVGAIANKTEVVSFRAIEKALEKGYKLVMTAEVR